MNITGGTNLSLFEVQEAADIVATASDQDVNMIFGSVINENLKDEIVVTVIATGFNEVEASIRPTGRPTLGQQQQSRPQTQQTPQPSVKREVKREEVNEQPARNANQGDEALDIPTFLRNRNRRR